MRRIITSAHHHRNERSSEKNVLGSIRKLFEATLLLILLSPMAQTAVGQRSVPVTGLLSDEAVVFNTTSQKIYAVDSLRGVVSIIDTKTQVRTQVKVGENPVAIAVNSATNKVYVANNGSGSISVLDGRTDAVTATIEIGKTPYVLAVNEVTNRVYVSNTFSDVISVIDGGTNAVHRIKAGSADKIRVDSKRNLVYLMGYEVDHLTILDGDTEKLRHVSVGALHLWDIALNKNTGEAFVTRIEESDVIGSGTTLQGSSTIATGKMPCAIRIDAGRNRMYVANYAGNSITIIDTAKRVPIKTIPVGDRPQAMALDERANLIFVANTHGNSISVIDGTLLKVIATLPTEKNPYALAIDLQNGGLYAADLSMQAITRVDVSSFATHVPENTGN